MLLIQNAYGTLCLIKTVEKSTGNSRDISAASHQKANDSNLFVSNILQFEFLRKSREKRDIHKDMQKIYKNCLGITRQKRREGGSSAGVMDKLNFYLLVLSKIFARFVFIELLEHMHQYS